MRRWPSTPQPGTHVWIRYGGTVCYGQVVHCMPELNMFTVRPADGSSSLVTRGLEDILPSTPQQSILTPPTEDEWDSDMVVCDESRENPHDIGSFTTQCETSISDSFSYPLFIDVLSRGSIDEGASYEPMTTLSGLPSNSTPSFSLSPILSSSDVIDVNIRKPSVERFGISSQKTYIDDSPYVHPSLTFGTSLPSHRFMDHSSVVPPVTQRISPTNSNVYFHKRWDAFSSQPELSSKELKTVCDEASPLNNQQISPSHTGNFPSQSSVNYMVDAVLHWVESVSPNAVSDSSAVDKMDVSELKETMKSFLTSNSAECDCIRSCHADSHQPSTLFPFPERTHMPVIRTSSESSEPSPSSNICNSPKPISGVANRGCIPSHHVQPTEFRGSDPQHQERSQYSFGKHTSKCPRYLSSLVEQNPVELLKEKIPLSSICGCKSFQGETTITNVSRLNPICENLPTNSPTPLHCADSMSDSGYAVTTPDSSTIPLVYAQQILPSLINERGSLSFQLLSSILAHSRIECDQDSQRSMLLDGLKQALGSVMLSSTNVPSVTSTSMVYYGADPVYSKTHSSMLHEDKSQLTTGYMVPVRRHLSCVGSTDNLSPGSLVESPTHNLCLDSQRETRNRFSRPSESDSCFSESCISPNPINIDHNKEPRMTSSSYPGGGTDRFYQVFFPTRNQEYKSGDFHLLETLSPVEQVHTSVHESSTKTDAEVNRTSKHHFAYSSFSSQPRKLDYKDPVVPLRVGLPSLTPTGRADVRKCRKVYGIENRDQWCNQCKWKKACRRFPNPCPTSRHPQGVTNRNFSIEKGNRQSLDSNVSETCVTCSSDLTIPNKATPSSWSVSSFSSCEKSSNCLTDSYMNQTGE
ncbi:unnamed protein product [Heterobilharzia americana]|nr:unnamed protein product [Heterobilharzia americana]